MNNWIDVTDDGLTSRMRVPGGWIVRVYVWDYATDNPVSASLVFVPGDGEWSPESEKEPRS